MSETPVHKIAARIRIASKAAQLLGKEADWDPIDLLIEVSLGAELTRVDDGTPMPSPDLDQRMAAANTLISLIHPKLKQIEVSGPDGKPIAPMIFYLPENGRDVISD